MDKRLKEINDRKLEIRSMLQGEEKVDLNALEKELANLEAEATELRRRQKLLPTLTQTKLNLQKFAK